jgi:uncharacterized protein
MGKVVFWIVVVFVLLLGLRLFNAGKAKRRAQDAGRTKVETMVRCAKCGVFLPQADARPLADGFVCDPGCTARR